MKIEEKLYYVKYNPDKVSHIEIIDDRICQEMCKKKVCTYICPAEVYKLEGNKIIIGYENCLECGTCRLACPYENISWKYPRGGFGVKYRYG